MNWEEWNKAYPATVVTEEPVNHHGKYSERWDAEKRVEHYHESFIMGMTWEVVLFNNMFYVIDYYK